MKIVQLFPNDVDKVTELFIEQSAHFPYYAELAKQYNMKTIDYINTVLKNQFLQILKTGQSYGVIENDELTGYFLCFCVQQMKSFDKETYDEIFKGAQTLQSLIEEFVGPTCFIICTNVAKNRSQRTISKLLRVAIDEISGSYNFITDIIPDDILRDSMLQMGFKQTERKGYKLFERLYSRDW